MACTEDCGYIEKEPICFIESWEHWYYHENPKYGFEIYEDDEDTNSFELLKDWEECLERGMALIAYNYGDDIGKESIEVIYKYEDMTRDEGIPDEVRDFIKNLKTEYFVDDLLTMCGYIAWELDREDKVYVYGEYLGNDYCLGC